MDGAQRVLVAMSGGVDSSVAAALLMEQGYDLVGITLHLWDAAGDQKVGRCCAPEDRDDARRTCEHLGIPHYVLDERDAFRDEVVDPFVASYRAGRTPSPCVSCNRTVKLVMLSELAQRFGCSYVATGHYARIRRDPGGSLRLLRGVDPKKDQSYFLFGLPQPTLAKLIFPLGELDKERTREEGRRLGVPNADKPDSQELCFVPDGDVASFVAREAGAEAGGFIRDSAGAVLGEHRGVSAFTVGQRRGLSLGGGAPPRYVLRIVGDTGDIVVGGREELLNDRIRAEEAHWIGERPEDPFCGEVRIRHRHRPARAQIVPGESGFEARFEEPQRAITPGQAAVIYRGDEVLGGGFIA